MNANLLAAVDLGSNSFRLLIGKVAPESDHVVPIDALKETLRLAAGLNDQKCLEEPAIERALAVLQRFGERLRSFSPDRVRAVATNTFRIARNVHEFLPRAEVALGFPIEIIAGREEARLIFAGVSHSLPPSSEPRLVVDIGGGSTEFIIGQGFEPLLTESLALGCVSFTQRYFKHAIDARAFNNAELAARSLLESAAPAFIRHGWTHAYGSSGTSKALTAILTQSGWSDQGMTLTGLKTLKAAILRAGSVGAAKLAGIKPDRVPVLAGGLSIMLAVFETFGIESMDAADGALRLGVLYDLLGRDVARDQRQDTVAQFMRRYDVDRAQAARVRKLACDLFDQMWPQVSTAWSNAQPATNEQVDDTRALLGWTAELHELGLSIAHHNYPRHSAYLLEHADMPGFSRRDQLRMATYALAQQGRLHKLGTDDLPPLDRCALLALRLAVIFCRRREDAEPTFTVKLRCSSELIRIDLPDQWRTQHPLTDYLLIEEADNWRKSSLGLQLE